MDCSPQTPPSMGFSRQGYWSELPFPSLGDLPDPGLNPGLPHCRQRLYCLSHQGNKECLIQISPGCPLEGLLLKLKLQYFGHMMRRADSFQKTLMLGKIWGREEKGTTEDEMVGWHHQFDGYGFGWTPGVGDGQRGVACCGSWGHR